MKTTKNKILSTIVLPLFVFGAAMLSMTSADATIFAGHLRVTNSYPAKNFQVKYIQIFNKHHVSTAGKGNWQKNGDVIGWANGLYTANDVYMHFTTEFLLQLDNKNIDSQVTTECRVDVGIELTPYVIDCNITKVLLNGEDVPKDLGYVKGQRSTRYAEIRFYKK